ncbi:A/G-specific adenine glycosylase [Elongatibacter sediminis]|uniref:Adenine DNA glycosylase n=1 Tax=Elongatibacter sediminis TaxID=3119006 RepID=A0AAW9RGP8_9GAMM
MSSRQARHTAGCREPFASRLLAWWERHGRHDLPWQHPRTPYRVWVSEIMLQQTQVATVIPYFERWMERFPALPDLAGAALDDVLSHWSGLGYYARARNLHKAAVNCMAQFGGELPTTPEQLQELPGIGASTANAIVSQSQDVPAAVLDGNVRRVLARHACVEEWTGSTAAQKTLWAEAEKRLPNRRGADYTQAVMDLGAIVCTRSRPACGDCPVNGDCRALAANAVNRLPAPKPATRVRERTIYLLVLLDRAGHVLLERRPPAGIWGGLWSLPEADTSEGFTDTLGIRIDEDNLLAPREHRLSHRKLSLHPVLAHTGQPGQVKCSAQQDWFPLAGFATGGPDQPGLPRPVADLLREIALQRADTRTAGTE